MSAAASSMPDPAEWPDLVPQPGSIAWARAGDARLLLAAGYALVLQVCHPVVGAGVSEHSQFRSDPWGRLLRTLDYSYTMVYGGPQAAGEMGRRIRSMHARIHGTLPNGRRYHALEPRAYAWVHATLAEAIVRAHATFGSPLAPAEREQFWREWRALGRLLGIGEADLPASWERFGPYFEEMLDSCLVPTPAAADVLAALARPAPPGAAALLRGLWALGRPPFSHLLGLLTVGLLAPRLRTRLAVPWSSGRERELRATAAALRGLTPLMPPVLANVGPRYLRLRAHAIACAAGTASSAGRRAQLRETLGDRDDR
jgi:uncharacterized protein (DUF2236 family)